MLQDSSTTCHASYRRSMFMIDVRMKLTAAIVLAAAEDCCYCCGAALPLPAGGGRQSLLIQAPAAL
jgi:hypothetical protein